MKQNLEVYIQDVKDEMRATGEDDLTVKRFVAFVKNCNIDLVITT